MNDSEWQSVKEYNPQDWYEGEIGRIFGCRFIESSEAKVFRSESLTTDGRLLMVGEEVDKDANTISVDGGFSQPEAESLVGKYLSIGPGYYTVVAADASSGILTVDDIPSGAELYAGMEILSGNGGCGGIPVYSTLFIGADAYGVTEVEGGGLKTIIKQLGSAGSGDPLDQRATVGWKALKTAAILSQPFMVRVETASSLED
ncbi:MAG: N4-gp56 family major capsid protein [Oscillospiraceae bacterium]|nr:N4-gp56 family major capsid protein [Oscillospiraceae bacterium]